MSNMRGSDISKSGIGGVNVKSDALPSKPSANEKQLRQSGLGNTKRRNNFLKRRRDRQRNVLATRRGERGMIDNAQRKKGSAKREW